MLSLIVAMGHRRVIGAKNRLPWHLPADLKRFKALTMGHHVIMGRKTFDSILAPDSFGKPLPGRTNVIITRQADYRAPDGCLVVRSLAEALELSRGDPEPYVIGGGEIFAQALGQAGRAYVTEIDVDVAEGDAFFPTLDPSEWREIERLSYAPDERNKHAYVYLTYEKK